MALIPWDLHTQWGGSRSVRTLAGVGGVDEMDRLMDRYNEQCNNIQVNDKSIATYKIGRPL